MKGSSTWFNVLGFLIVALLLLAFGAAAAGAAPANASCTGMILGRVTSGGAPVAGALVRAYSGSQLRGTTTTNTSGNFTFTALPGGVSYNLKVATANKPEVVYGPFGPLACGTILNVGTLKCLAPSALGVQGTVWRDMNRDGKVDTGEPRYLGWQVELHKVGDSTALATTQTNSEGQYQLPMPYPGTYKVILIEPGRPLSHVSPQLQLGQVAQTADFDTLRSKWYVR